MQELFANLQQELAAGGSNAPSVQPLLQQIQANHPKESWIAQAMVDGTAIGEGGQPSVSNPPQSSWLSAKSLLPLLGGLGIGGGAGVGLSNLSWQDIQKLPLPQVTNQWELLAIVGAVGGIVGVAYSFYRNNWTLLIPSVSVSRGRLQIKTLGFVRNLIAAAVVSVATTWIAYAHAGVGGPAAPGDNHPSLLTWNILMSAVAAGIVGSRMASGEVEKNTLWQALSASVEATAVPGLGKEVRNAATPFKAAAIASQVAQTVDGPSQIVQTEENLLDLFDRPALKAALMEVGKPLGPDGAGLKVTVLELFQPLRPAIRTLLGDFTITGVAWMPPESFAQEADNRGIESSKYKDLLSRLHGDCVRVMELFGSLPTTWTLDPQRL